MGAVDIVVVRPSQDMINLKAWGDHKESGHLTILVVTVRSVGTRPIQYCNGPDTSIG